MGVKSLYDSKNLALAKLLEKKRLDLYVYDEMYTKEEIMRLSLKFIEPEKADLAFDSFELVIK